MTTFREQALQDLRAILDPTEFAEPVEIEGVEVSGVLELRKGQPEGDPGINLEELEIRARASDLPDLKPGQQITVNGAAWFVRSLEKEDGLSILFAYRNLS